MKNPIFENDPITMVAEAFEILHPETKYEAAYAPELYDENGTPVCSCITFPDEADGSDAAPVIIANSQLAVEMVAKAFAEELIHAALGPDSLEHGPEYDAELEALEKKYHEIAAERFPAPTEEGGDQE